MDQKVDNLRKDEEKMELYKQNSARLTSKEALFAFEEFANSISQEATDKGITEEMLLAELEKVRKEMWDERNKE